MESPDVYLFVISSLNHPVFRQVQEKRKKLLHHYNIPYTVLINSDESDVHNEKDETTLIPLTEDEILYNGGGYNPFMAQKFLMGVKMLFRSYRDYDDIPNYIIRINATVYVHYPSLLEILHHKDFPRERVLAGPNWGNVFVQGMVMVFSKDVLFHMIKDPRIYQKSLMKLNDDVSLSFLADPYSKWVDWNDHLCASWSCSVNKNGIYLLNKIKPRENHKWMFRIREDADGRWADLKNWDNLMRYFNEPFVEESPIPLIIEDQHGNCSASSVLEKIGNVLFWVCFLLVVYVCIHVFVKRSKRIPR